MGKRKLVTALVCALVLAATAFRVYLAYKTPISPGTYARVDDGLLMNYANTMRAGNWLGAYGELTLVKNPGYSLMLAAFHKFGLRYQLGFVLLLCFACGVAARSLRPLVPSLGIRAVLFLVLLYMPAFFTSYFFMRVYRNGISIVMALLLFGSLVGLYLRRRQKLRIVALWSILAGSSLGMFSIIQESAMWVLPFSCVCLGVTVVLTLVDARRDGAAQREDEHGPRHFARGPQQVDEDGAGEARSALGTVVCVALLVLPLVMYAGAIASISYLNQRFYGVSLLNDKYQGEFARATADVMRIDAGYDDQRVWVSVEALDRALRVSPTLAQMEGEIRDNWAIWEEISAGFGVLDSDAEPQVLGDHPYWALRDAYAAYGGYTSAQETERYWGAVANEIEAAFKSGELRQKEGVFLSATTQPLQADQILPWTASSVEALGHFAWGDLLRATMIQPFPNTQISEGALGVQMAARELLGNNTIFYVGDELYQDDVLEIAKPWLALNNGLGNALVTAQRVLIVLALVGLPVLVVLDMRARNLDGVRSALILVGLCLSAFVLVFGSTWMISFLSTGESAVAAENPAFAYCGSVFALLGLCLCLVLGRLAQRGLDARRASS